jgi:signal peptidase
VLGWAVTGLAALLVLACLVWVTLPKVLGARPFVVLTGSMAPALPVGSVALVRPVQADQVRVGDILTFYHPESRSRALITHRVIEVTAVGGGREFRTQGDANDLPDDWVVSQSNVYGTVSDVVPYMGYVTEVIQSRLGFLLLMGVPGSIIVVGEISNIWQQLAAGRAKSSPT